MTEKATRAYTQWDNIYAAHRAFTDGANRKLRLSNSPSIRRKAGWLIDRAAEDFELFSSLVDIQDITSTEPFLIGAKAHVARAKLAMQQQSPYSDEITNRALDMPLRMAFNFFVLGQPAPHGRPVRENSPQSAASRKRTINNLERAHVTNFREVLLLGQRRIRNIQGLGPVTLGQTVQCIHAIDARIELPKGTYPHYAALLYGDISEVPARALTDVAPHKTKDLTVGGVLDMPLDALTTTFGKHGEHIQEAAVAFEGEFKESEERRVRLETESRLYVESLAPPPIDLPLPQ